MSDTDLLLTHHVGPDRGAEIAAAVAPAVDGEVIVARTPEETNARLGEVRAVVSGRFTEELVDAADRLEWLHVLSAGVDHVPLEALAERGVVVTNSAGVHAEPIAEQVLCYMLTFQRNLHAARRNQERGVWERVEGRELRDATVGIIGVGAIGGRVAELCAALGCEVLGVKRDRSTMPESVDRGFGPDEYHELLLESDYVVLACPLTDETEGLLGYEEFRVMRNDAVLVNIARGEVCEQDDLVRALQYGTIRGAALDVFETEPLPPESPLWDLSNVVITPHMAGSTPNKVDRWRELLATNYAALVANDPDAMTNRVV